MERENNLNENTQKDSQNNINEEKKDDASEKKEIIKLPI